jgi:hypothetical protein
MMQHILRPLACAVAFMMLGGLWYGALFAKPWMALIGMTPEKIALISKSGMIRSYALTFLAALLASHALDHLSHGMGVTDAMGGAGLGGFVGLGFVATAFGSTYLFGQKPFKLYLIDAGFQVVGLTIAGTILGAWQ